MESASEDAPPVKPHDLVYWGQGTWACRTCGIPFHNGAHCPNDPEAAVQPEDRS